MSRTWSFYKSFKNLIVGVNIRTKLLFLSALLILLLSISSVSADSSIDDSNLDIGSNLGIDSNLDLNADLYADLNNSDDFNNLNNYDYSNNYVDYSDILEGDSSNLEIEKNNHFNKLSSNNLSSNSLSSNELNSNQLNSNQLNSNSISNSNSNSNQKANSKDSRLILLNDKNLKVNGTEEKYFIKLVDGNGNPIPYADLIFNIDSSIEFVGGTVRTDENGIAYIFMDFSYPGPYTVYASFEGDGNHNPSSTLSSTVSVYKDTEISSLQSYGYLGENFSFKITSCGEPVSNQKVLISIDNKNYTATTDSEGIAKVKLPNQQKTYSISCNFSNRVYYYGSSLSKNVPVYKRAFTQPNCYALLRKSTFTVTLKGADGKILSNRTLRFIVDGKEYNKTTNSKGAASINIDLERGEYRINYYFNTDGVYGPLSNYTDLNVVDPSGQYKMLLNVKSSASAKIYLTGGGYATVTSLIKSTAKSITKKYKTNFEKAVAIYNYVRDNLDYQYYYNTRKGATKTLKTKSGNCCDHANLVVALCRASGIPARYSNSKYCVFGSGLRSGHVWAQIYVGDTWYSADATSSRNTLGHIENWDTKTNKKDYNFRNLPF